MKSYKCFIFHCKAPLKCGFIGSIAIYGNGYDSAKHILNELHSKGIGNSVVQGFSLEAWQGDRTPRKMEKFNTSSPQIYYLSHSDQRAFTLDGVDYEGNGYSIEIKFFNQRVMNAFLQELSKMSSIKETLVSKS